MREQACTHGEALTTTNPRMWLWMSQSSRSTPGRVGTKSWAWPGAIDWLKSFPR